MQQGCRSVRQGPSAAKLVGGDAYAVARPVPDVMRHGRRRGWGCATCCYADPDQRRCPRALHTGDALAKEVETAAAIKA